MTIEYCYTLYWAKNLGRVYIHPVIDRDVSARAYLHAVIIRSMAMLSSRAVNGVSSSSRSIGGDAAVVVVAAVDFFTIVVTSV